MRFEYRTVNSNVMTHSFVYNFLNGLNYFFYVFYLYGNSIDLDVLKKSVTSKEIKEQLKWLITRIDLIGCELTQNIAKELKEK